MYKLSYYRFGELKFDYNTPAGFDRYNGNWFIRNCVWFIRNCVQGGPSALGLGYVDNNSASG